jgi:ABC-type transporter Mla subunit MlaD
MNSLLMSYDWHYLVFGLLAILLLSFIALFFVPGWIVGSQLRRVIKGVAAEPHSADLTQVFAPIPRLRHLWSEFRETLHDERQIDSKTGVSRVVALRATLPAEAFFTEETIVNTPLRAEFFKHLPGIFTGIGIIGTFAGLLIGLKDFHVTDDPSAARQGLDLLLGSVANAFVVSATAIALAMLVTFVEKIMLVRLYRKVQQLTQSIDERFKAGVGEEYLARLVGASEESASQSRILKDALVGDLKTILTEISDKQISAFSTTQLQLGQKISDSVAGQLAAPLERLAAITEGVRGDQSSAVQQLMADLLSRFTDRIENIFGGQVSGMQQMQQQAVAALTSAVQQLQQMSATVEGAGQRASSALMEKLEQSLGKLDHRQLVMNEEMRKFVHEIRSVVGQSQTETQQQVQVMLTDLARQTSALVSGLSEKSQEAVSTMGGQVDGLATKMVEAASQVSSAISRIENVTTDAITRMNAGAETLALAVDDFARAGAGVSGVMQKAQEVGAQLTQSSLSLSAASNSIELVARESKAIRESLAQMLSAVSTAVQAAKKEASLTTDVLQRIDAAAGKLAVAQRSADDYLSRVTDVLAASHEGFADSMKRTLEKGNGEFFEAMSRATKMLREAISELESTLGGIGPRSSARVR